MSKPEKVAIISCDQELYIEISTHLQHSLTGHNIFYSDSLKDLVKRHCPELYDIANEAGYIFIPSDDKEELMANPPEFWFDIVEKSDGSQFD